MRIEGTNDVPVFLAYVRQVLAPTSANRDVEVMDTLSFHKVAGVRKVIEARGAKDLHLTPCLPDYLPIELCLSKLNTALRTAKARAREALDDALAATLAMMPLRCAKLVHPLWACPTGT